MTAGVDPVLDERRVLALVRSHVPRAERVTGIDESGGEARAYFVDGDLVLKTQRPHRRRAKTSLEREALVLREIERQGVDSVPRALGYGDVDGVEYLCLTRIHGTASARRLDALEDLGRTVRRVHGLDQTAFAECDLFACDADVAGLRSRLADTFAQLARSWDGSGDIPAFARVCLEQVTEDFEPVVLHSNPGPTHTLVDDDDAFRGLIDFGDAYRSHPALDLCAWSDDAAADAAFAGYCSIGAALPPGFDAVRRTGRVIAELTRATKGRRDPADAIAAVERLIG